MFEHVERIADAILYEGYVLYPYRSSSAKNQFRWQFGVLAPEAPEAGGEPSFSQTECLIESGGGVPRLWVRVRGLRPRPAAPDMAAPSRLWLEGAPMTADPIVARPIEPLPLEDRVPLTESDLDGWVIVHAERNGTFIKVQVRIENRERWRPEFESSRDTMLERSLVGTHLLLAVDGGEFVSLLEPPPRAVPFIGDCDNRHTWPVLVGSRSAHAFMLSSPIVLYDYPSVAAESPCDLCDAAEIDEILLLRILTMTDEEKLQARATDPRARAILDRVEGLSAEALAALHGTMRSADFFNPPDAPPPDAAYVLVEGRRVTKGTRVRLRPNRRADAMDMFLSQQPATVAGVYRDVDERVYVAVTVDADPAASLHESFGRFFYFDPAEVEPLDPVEPIDRQEERV